jgi:hypothetical protein
LAEVHGVIAVHETFCLMVGRSLIGFGVLPPDKISRNCKRCIRVGRVVQKTQMSVVVKIGWARAADKEFRPISAEDDRTGVDGAGAFGAY